MFKEAKIFIDNDLRVREKRIQNTIREVAKSDN